MNRLEEAMSAPAEVPAPAHVQERPRDPGAHAGDDALSFRALDARKRER